MQLRLHACAEPQGNTAGTTNELPEGASGSKDVFNDATRQQEMLQRTDLPIHNLATQSAPNLTATSG